MPDNCVNLSAAQFTAFDQFLDLRVNGSPACRPLGQLVGPPCSRFVPAFDAQVADFTIFVARLLERAGKDRHSVDGRATGTGIFTSVAGSHAGFG
jgi:hypothetical protein